MEFKVMQKVLDANEHLAGDIRKLLEEKGATVFNMISSPGSGKTTLLEKTIPALQEKGYSVGIIEGDVETDRDAQRLKRFGIPMVLINTKGACHLDSQSILIALNDMPLDDIDVIFVENVGNLVCPAEFNIGEDAKIAVFSVPEGDDKPEKYPLLFREASVVVLNKVDMLSVTNFNKDRFIKEVQSLNGAIDVIEMAAVHGDGIEGWLSWIESNIKQKVCV